MGIRVYDIHVKYGVENAVLIDKLRTLGYRRITQPSATIDNITAEYLINDLGLKERPQPTGAGVAQPTILASKAERRLLVVKGSIAGIKLLLSKGGLSDAVRRRAKDLSLLLRVCESKDWHDSPPSEKREADLLLEELKQRGFQFIPPQPKQPRPKAALSAQQLEIQRQKRQKEELERQKRTREKRTRRLRRKQAKLRLKKKKKKKRQKSKGGDAMFRVLPGCYGMGKRR